MVWKKKEQKPLTLVLVTVLLLPSAELAGCGGIGVRPIVPPPPATLSCSVSPATVYPGDRLTVSATSAGLDPARRLKYRWTLSGNPIPGQEGATVEIDTRQLEGHFTVTGTVAMDQRPSGPISCTADFTVRAVEPPTISCSANPGSVGLGDPVTISTSAVSPHNRPLVYSYSSTNGNITGSGSTATLSTVGVAPGNVMVTCNVADDKGQVASATTTINVVNPREGYPVVSSIRCVATPNRARPGDPVRLEIEPAPPAGAVPYVVRWHPSAGVLDAGHDSTVVDTTGLSPGVIAVSADVSQAGRQQNCSTSFVLDTTAPVAPWPYLEIVRIERRPGRPEPAGYGVYTYLVYRKRPEKNDKDGYTRFRSILAAIAQYKAPELEGQPSEEGQPNALPVKAIVVDNPVPRRELAPLIVPVDADTNFTVDDLAEHYNAPLATQLVRNLDCQQVVNKKDCVRFFTGDGPYLVSTTVRITARPRGFLMQNLDNTTPEVAGQWISAYMNMVSQEKNWSQGYTLEQARLDFFKELDIAGNDLTNSKTAVIAAIKWFSFGKSK
ncbi:MAG TPA: hypothetical protein VGN01_20075 [Acidobacteriaceae bacterium]|jgi:hypothetical protein